MKNLTLLSIIIIIATNSALEAQSLVRRAAQQIAPMKLARGLAKQAHKFAATEFYKNHPWLMATGMVAGGALATTAADYATYKGYKKFAVYRARKQTRKAAQLREARKKIFITACQVGDQVRIKELLLQPVNALADGYAEEGLIEAASKGKPHAVQELLAAGVRVNEDKLYQLKRSADAWKTVNEATENLDIGPVEPEAAERERVFTNNLWKLLRDSTATRLPESTRFVNLGKKNAYGHNALTLAALYGRLEFIEPLMALGTLVDNAQLEKLPNKDAALAKIAEIRHAQLWVAVAKNERDAVRNILAKPGVNVNVQKMIRDDFNNQRVATTPLMEALKNNYFELAEDLIIAGAEVDAAAVNRQPNTKTVWAKIHEAHEKIKVAVLAGIDTARAQSDSAADFPTAVRDVITSYLMSETQKKSEEGKRR